ncbi:MAG: alpha/beta hydrolase [Alphaproteobacteria bacterium]|nr:alpha/beta hydrolase [Alphaproteobacteria bacterium]
MDLVSIPANPVPEGAVTGMLKTRDGVNIRFARWLPPPGRKGTVCLFQGRAEFIEKYFETVRELRARGFAVATIDWRGQGGSDRALSDPRKGHVGDFSEYERDIEVLMNEIVLPDCPPPIFAIAHSMGGTVMMRVARQGSRWFDRIVLSAPMLRLAGNRQSTSNRIAVRAMRLMGMGSAYVPGGSNSIVAAGSYVNNIATTDPVRHARTKAVLDAAPELGLGSPSVSWLNAAYRAMGAIEDASFASKVRQPLMLIAAGRDQVVSTAAIEDLAIRLRAGSHLIIAGARHEIMMEQDRYRAQFWAAFDAFVPGTPLFK